MKKIIILAESGSDVNPQLAAQYDVAIIPMHVNFDDVSRDDGTFDPQEIVDFYRQTGKLPKTSASTPDDFMRMFDKLHTEHPDAHILYLAYSAVTTCTYANAKIAAEDADYITMLDTKLASAGQGIVVMAVADYVNNHPDATIEEVVEVANDYIARGNMCFLPDNLEFLRAGGRVSNVAYLGSRILNLHPCIEFVDGQLIATKKYRGNMVKVAAKLVEDYSEKYNLDRSKIWFIHSVSLSEEVRQSAEQAAKEAGFEDFMWIRANGVITTHGGPAAFGMAGFSKK